MGAFQSYLLHQVDVSTDCEHARPYSNVFGLEPNYPYAKHVYTLVRKYSIYIYRCCTVNYPQGWPKFVSNAFVTTPDSKSLVHVYLGPFSTNTILANG